MWPRTNRILPWLAAIFLTMLWLVPFDSLSAPINLGVDSKLDRIVLVLMFGVWMIVAAAGGRYGPRWRKSPLNVAILIFLVVVIVSIAVRLPVLSNLDEVSLSIKQLALLLSYLALYYFVMTSVRPREVRNFLRLMVILACFTAIGTILEYRGYGNFFYNWSSTLLSGFHVSLTHIGSGYGRQNVVGPTQAPLADATILCIALSFALVFLIHSRDRRGKVLWFIASAILLAGTLSTQRKSAVIIPLGALIVLVLYQRKRMVRFLPAFVGLVLAIYVISPHAISGIRYQFQVFGGSTSTQSRTDDYTAITPDILAHPLLGRGYGSYDPHVYRILDNQYLGLLVESGFLGLAGYVLVLATGAVLAHTATRSRDRTRGPAAVALLGAIVGFAIANSTFDVLAFAQAPYMLMFVLALSVVAADQSDVDPAEAAAAIPATRRDGDLEDATATRPDVPPDRLRHKPPRPPIAPRRPAHAPGRLPSRPVVPAAPRVRLPSARVRLPSARLGRPFKRLRGAHPSGIMRSRVAMLTLGSTIIASMLGFGVGRSANASPVSPATVKHLAAPAQGPSSAYGQALNQVIANLNGARTQASSQLKTAHTAKAQAAVAQKLASAHDQAASAILRLNAGRERAANATLAAALRKTGSVYVALAHAAARGDRRGYSAARASLARADQSLAAAFAQLSALGYHVS